MSCAVLFFSKGERAFADIVWLIWSQDQLDIKTGEDQKQINFRKLMEFKEFTIESMSSAYMYYSGQDVSGYDIVDLDKPMEIQGLEVV